MNHIAMTNWNITPINFEKSGGLERVILSEAKSLSNLGYDVTIASKKFIGNSSIHNLQTIPTIPLLDKYYFIFYYLFFLCLNRSASIYHAHNSPFVAVLNSKKTLVHLHNEVRFPGYEKFKYVYKKGFYAVCSNYLKSWLMKNYSNIREENIFVVYNAVDPEKFHPISENKPVKLPLKILFAGQLNEEKGIFVLLKAVDILNKLEYPVQLTVAGSENLWQNGNSKSRILSSKKGELNLKNVAFLGAISHDAMPSVYQSADLLIVPSIWNEPFGLVAVEAMATGLPVIAFSTGGLPEIVCHEVTGLLLGDKTPDALASAIKYFIDNPKKLSSMGNAARNRALEFFSMNYHMNSLLKIYKYISLKK
jgi:spore coat protein SA